MLGARVKSLRTDKGISRERLAVDADIPYSTIKRIEEGAIPRADRLARIARVLGVTTDELLEGAA